MSDASDRARMVPMLPCADIDDMATFWTSLGLDVTYRQVRPNPYLALRRNAIELHYYGMDGVNPDQSHSTCSIVVPDTAPLYELFVGGLRARFGQVPIRGLPRITRPRQRANNAGLSGFSIVDPAGNWIRVTRSADAAHEPKSVDDRTQWVSAGGGPLARAMENAVVLADSHGDEVQAQRTLAGAIARHAGAPLADRARPPGRIWPSYGYVWTMSLAPSVRPTKLRAWWTPRTSRRETRRPSVVRCARSPNCPSRCARQPINKASVHRQRGVDRVDPAHYSPGDMPGVGESGVLERSERLR